MADINQSNWTETDSGDNQAAPLGFTSGTMLPSGVEPTGRAIMGAIKRWYDREGPTVTSTGSANAHVLTYSVAPAALAAGDPVCFIAGFTNAADTTLTINGLSAGHFKWHGANLVGGEIVAGRVVYGKFDGTNTVLLNSQLEVSSAALPTIPIANGGTGQTTALAAFNAIVAIGATVANPGFIKLENGLVFQWGHVAYTGATSVTATFATAFGGTVFSASGISDDTGVKPITTLSALSLTQITFVFDKSSTGNVYYWAVGN